MTRHLLLFTALAASAALAACTSGRASESTAPAAAPVDVAVATATRTELPSSFEAGGIVRARLVTPIASRVMASVVDVPVRAGAAVRRGALLVALDPREMRAHLDSASASVAAATESVTAAESDVTAAEASLALARATHQRIAALAERRSATPHELDEATAAMTAATARLRGAQARLAAATASRDAARAGQAAADTGVSYTRLTAPFDGVVSERLVDPGVVVTPGMPLLTLEDRSALLFEVRLDDSRAASVQRGQTIDIALAPQGTGAPTSWLQATVVEIARIDPMSHAFVVKASLPSDTADARSGAYGRARFTSGARTALTVPTTALVKRGQLVFVFTVDAQHVARLRAISTGDTRGDRVEVLAGLSEGAAIVAAPPASLADGTPVRSGAAAGAQR